MALFLKAETEEVKKMYLGHGIYNDGDAGIDIFFPENVIIPAKGTAFIDFKIKCEVREYPVSFEDDKFINKSYFLFPRSSIAKTPLRLANSIGLIDAKYRGNIKAAIDNISENDFHIKKGSRLFQIVLPELEPILMILADELS